VLHDGQRIGATASIGVASYPEHGNNMQVLVHAADLALYEAKHNGRNCVRVAKHETNGALPAPAGLTSGPAAATPLDRSSPAPA
jgi:predicted signal transduction protein with EAL and GGDEF domain